MRSMRRIFVLCSLAWCAQAASLDTREYVNQALDAMQQHSLHKKRIDWADLRENVLARASGDDRPNARYDAIRYALALLGDHHGRFLPPPRTNATDEERAAFRAGVVNKPEYLAPEGHLERVRAGVVARIVIPRYLTDDRAIEFASGIQNLLRELAAARPVGWIVDLRGNGGGNMWPMLAGIGPLLGPGVSGGFVDADGHKSTWSYEHGAATMHEFGGKTQVSGQVTGNPFVFPSLPAVAVLIDGYTASSGEVIAISFCGRPKTRFFGSHTAGVSTSVRGFLLSDGAVLRLETAVDIDRNGNLYGDGVEPDVVIPAGESAGVDVGIRAACDWLTGKK